MRAVADFDPEWAGSYFVPRTTVTPPASLQRQIWPAVDLWREVHENPATATSGIAPNKAAGAFLELLCWLREVLLQDAAFLIQLYPDHPLFKHPIFSSREFLGFASEVRAASEELHRDSYTETIQKAMPAVSDKLQAMAAQQVAESNLARDRHLAVVAEIQALRANVQEYAQTTFTITTTTTISPGGTTRRQEQVAHRVDRVSAQEASPAPRPPQQRTPVLLNGPPRAAPILAAPAGEDANAQPPCFSLPRDIRTVADLLKLWKYGLGIMPSVRSLEQRWGARWRPSTSAERQAFSSRNRIIREIERRAEITGLAEEVVASEMDRERGTASLDKVFKALKARDKQ